MESITNTFSYACYSNDGALPPADAALLQEARKITQAAYAPYSHFRVGAAIRLSGDRIVTGSNQENASFPAGLCAERVALSAVASGYPGIVIESLAVSYDNGQGASDHPVSPCGICRQSLAEYEQRQQHPIRLVLGGLTGKVYVIPAVSLLLPLGFSREDMTKG